MKKKYLVLFSISLVCLLIVYFVKNKKTNLVEQSEISAIPWKIKAVDTVKYSRDIAREKLDDSEFDIEIENQVKDISKLGVTHIAIGTPYDEEFVPYLTRWVEMARKYNLSVWFRGNFSGWEEWFGYEKILKSQHIDYTYEFIISNPNLFYDGDIFTPCTECENGALGDPRLTGEVDEFRDFLINLKKISDEGFDEIGTKVEAGYFSMNGDVAMLIMDKETTKMLGGIVVVDHYVEDPKDLVSDLEVLAEKSGGKVILGEVGAPVPDIHGQMNEDEQESWINDLFIRLASTSEVVGVNYWTNIGSSTELWNDQGKPKKATTTIKKFYAPKYIRITVKSESGKEISNYVLSADNHIKRINGNQARVYCLDSQNIEIKIRKKGYNAETKFQTCGNDLQFVLSKDNIGVLQKLIDKIL